MRCVAPAAARLRHRDSPSRAATIRCPLPWRKRSRSADIPASGVAVFVQEAGATEAQGQLQRLAADESRPR
ncbi:MAG: hypothetical protein MZW92_11160 [Comamonadaceae bacterium]|nr:hypothetical protein [Comamonadaceae bacterium]